MTTKTTEHTAPDGYCMWHPIHGWRIHLLRREYDADYEATMRDQFRDDRYEMRPFRMVEVRQEQEVIG